MDDLDRSPEPPAGKGESLEPPANRRPPGGDVIDLYAVSRGLMTRDLAKSELRPEDFAKVGLPEPRPVLVADGEVNRYKLFYTPTYSKLRWDRADDKYTGPKGVSVPRPLLRVAPDGGKDYNEKFTATVEGLKKSVKFTLSTGIDSLAIDSCWDFGMSTGDDEVKQLNNDVLAILDPTKTHLHLIDSDWEDPSKDVGKAVAVASLLYDDLGITAHFPDLGASADGKRRGYDDWYVVTFGHWEETPSRKQVVDALLRLPAIPVAMLDITKSMALGTSNRFNRSYVDLTDRGNASLFLRMIRPQNVRYLTDEDKWVFWLNGRWEKYDGVPMEKANEVARHYLRRASSLHRLAEKAEAGGNTDKAKALRNEAVEIQKWATSKCSSTPGRKAFLEDASTRPYIQVTRNDFDVDPNLLGVAGGMVVDLRTGEVRDERQEDMLLLHAPTAYTGDEPQGESVDRFKRALREIMGRSHGVLDPANEHYVVMRMGASLRGYCSLDALEIWTGEGANGKSVLASITTATLGEDNGYSANVPASVILSLAKDRDAEAPNPHMWKCVGKRHVFMAETKDTAYLNEPVVKQVTGGDKFTARPLYKDGGSYTPTFTMFLLCNDMPNVASGDKAFWDRIGPLPFLCRWRRPNRVDGEHTTDPTEIGLPEGDLWLRDEAKGDAKVRAWWLWRLIQAGVEWEKNGKRLGEVPTRVLEALEDYKAEQDKYGRWMRDERWEFVPLVSGERTLSRELYANYSRWTQESGAGSEKDNIFARRFIKWSKGKAKSDGNKSILGIRRITAPPLKGEEKNM